MQSAFAMAEQTLARGEEAVIAGSYIRAGIEQ